MALGAVLLGLGNGLGEVGRQVGEADDIRANAAAAQAKQAAAAAAAQKAAEERAVAAAERRREFEAKQALALKKKPVGNPYVAGGKLVQRVFDPATQQTTVEEVKDAPLPETPAEAYKRSLLGIGMKDDAATKATEQKYAPAPKPSAESPDQKKYDLYKSIFGEDGAKRMLEVEGGLRARPKAAGGAAAGAGAPAGSDEVVAAANAIASNTDGTYTLDKLRMLNKPLAQKVNDYMLANGIKPGVKETGTQKQSEDSAKQLGQLLPTILPYVEKHKNDDLLDQASDKAKILLGYSQYSHGIDPGDGNGDLYQLIALSQVLGVQPWLKTGRNRLVYQDVLKHLPSPTDSSKQIYTKIVQLQKLLPMVESPTGEPAAAPAKAGGDSIDDQILKALGGK